MIGLVALVAAALFAGIAGSNDGTSLMSCGLRVPGLRPVTMLVTLLAALAVGPLLFGTRVAATLATRLSPLAGSQGEAITAVFSAVAVVFALNRHGLPTSSTLALVGAIAGTALAGGVPLASSVLLTVLALGLAAPVVSAGMAYGGSRVLRIANGERLPARLRRAHAVAFVAECLAYSFNGGQKVLAVFALASGAATGSPLASPTASLTVVGFFGLGVLASLRRVSGRLTKGVVVVHLRHAVTVEACSSVVALASGLMGVPLTASQSIAGALVGSAGSEGIRRVRLGAAARVLGAWILTLPASLALAAGGTGLLRAAGVLG